MKFTIITCIVLMLVSSFNAVHANYVILQVLLDTSKGSCTGKDWSHVTYRIYTMSQNQRQLRGGDIDTTDQDNAVVVDSSMTNATTTIKNTAERELAYPRECANSCRGYTTGRCMALNCLGYRRRGLAESMIMRKLFWSTSCENQKSELGNLLRNMANSNEVGASCKASLLQPAKMTCFSKSNC